MKKIFTLAATLVVAFSVNAQVTEPEIVNADIVILSQQTYVAEGSDAYTYKFSTSCKGITLGYKSGRDYASKCAGYTLCQNCTAALNFQNGKVSVINIPDGVKMYGVQFAGYSQGDNWCYLAAYGVGDNEGYEWVDTFGGATSTTDIKDNDLIISSARYPIDPCITRTVGYEAVPKNHNCGYTFASISFVDEPYEGEFPFVFHGNNQERALIRVFTSKEAWETYSAQCAAIDYGSETSAIESVSVENAQDDIMYNLSGQHITTAKGIYIQNGKKYIAQ